MLSASRLNVRLRSRRLRQRCMFTRKEDDGFLQHLVHDYFRESLFLIHLRAGLAWSMKPHGWYLPFRGAPIYRYRARDSVTRAYEP
jgi:hypothetical protein